MFLTLEENNFKIFIFWRDVRLIRSPLLADLENKTKINKSELNDLD